MTVKSRSNRHGKKTKAELTYDFVEAFEDYIASNKGTKELAEAISCLDEWRKNPLDYPKNRLGAKGGKVK